MTRFFTTSVDLQNTKGKEVKIMKKFIALALPALLTGALSVPASALPSLDGGESVIFYNNFENLYSSTGVFKAPGAPVVVGDHLFGIINAQNVDISGTTTWFSGPTEQLTGVFAQRVEAILAPDPHDPVNTQPHLVFGAPTVFTFGGVDISGKLAAGEMFALYYQSGVGTTVFESNGTIADDFAKATDGLKWLSLGYTAGADTAYGTADDDGYFYSHVAFGVPLANFTGEAWGALNEMVNNTGYILQTINDPNESESKSWLAGVDIKTTVHLSSELEGNPNFPAGTSPWAFRSNDPAHIATPEPSTLILLGAGLIGMAGYARRRMR